MGALLLGLLLLAAASTGMVHATELENLKLLSDHFKFVPPLSCSSPSLLVTCNGLDDASMTVVNILFGDTRLDAEIPEVLGTFTGLQRLVLSNCGLKGTLPTSLGRLTNLQVLDVRRNELQGSIPTELGLITPLVKLQLSRNFLKDPIPEELAGLVGLVEVDLSHNELDGTLSAQLSRLSNLESLDVSENRKLEGSIPASLPASLRVLRASGNIHDGILPSFELMRNLTELRLAGNKLDGGAFSWVGSAADGHFLNLETIDFSNNTFTEASLAMNAFPNVKNLYIGGNLLTGWLPTVFGMLSELRELDASSNQLSGAFPAFLSGLLRLRKLDLGHNLLQGPLVSSLGSLLSLMDLDLGNNQLTELPETFSQLTALQKLELQANAFDQPLPEWITNLVNLALLDLGRNSFSGTLPRDIGRMSDLIRLSLGHNKLSGWLPDSLTDLDKLERFDLSWNELSGEVLDDISRLGDLEYVELDQNRFSGSLPESLGQLKHLKVLRLDNNTLTGPLPDLSELDNLLELRLSNNLLSGRIKDANVPVNLVRLALHNNNFCGKPPNFLLADDADGSHFRLDDCNLGKGVFDCDDASKFQRCVDTQCRRYELELLPEALVDGNVTVGPTFEVRENSTLAITIKASLKGIPDMCGSTFMSGGITLPDGAMLSAVGQSAWFFQYTPAFGTANGLFVLKEVVIEAGLETDSIVKEKLKLSIRVTADPHHGTKSTAGKIGDVVDHALSSAESSPTEVAIIVLFSLILCLLIVAGVWYRRRQRASAVPYRRHRDTAA